MSQGQGPWSQPPRPSPPANRRLIWLLLLAGVGAVILALVHAFPEAVRVRGGWADVAYAAGLLVLISSRVLWARPGRWSQHLRHAAAWLGIVAVLALVAAYRDDLAGLPQHLRLAFSDGAPVQTADHELVVPQDDSGAFVIVARVNGQRVRFLVDTGASETVLSPDDAQRLGVDPASLRFDEEAETANGRVMGAAYRARRLEVGPIALDDFPMQVNAAPMASSLLGLTFLDRLESFEVRGRKLILRWRDRSPNAPPQ